MEFCSNKRSCKTEIDNENEATEKTNHYLTGNVAAEQFYNETSSRKTF